MTWPTRTPAIRTSSPARRLVASVNYERYVTPLAVLPLAVKTIALGPVPAPIGVPALLVAVLIGVTVPGESA